MIVILVITAILLIVVIGVIIAFSLLGNKESDGKSGNIRNEASDEVTEVAESDEEEVEESKWVISKKQVMIQPGQFFAGLNMNI